jgi:hypothetical protein
MIPIRFAPLPPDGRRREPSRLKEVKARAREGNVEWLRRVQAEEGILLVGGARLAHFRVRVAQAHLRSDLIPSYWSLAGLLEAGGRSFLSVPLDLPADVSEVPGTNAIQPCRLRDYDDPVAYPNLAVLRFTSTLEGLRTQVERLRLQRTIVDLPSLILPWLGFVWGTGDTGNPLLKGLGLPSAVFVETLFAQWNVDLAPGLASTAACPEAIWQSAKWWGPFYREAAARKTPAVVPTGTYVLRQPAAAVEPGPPARKSRQR